MQRMLPLLVRYVAECIREGSLSRDLVRKIKGNEMSGLAALEDTVHGFVQMIYGSLKFED
jgi:hypothetical protein